MPEQERGAAYPLYVRIRQEIALRGWTTVRLHKETGISRTAIDRMATRPRPPMPATVNAIADVLGIPRLEALRLAGVILDEGPPPDVRPALVRDNWADPQVRQLWQLRHIPDAAKLGLVTVYLDARADDGPPDEDNGPPGEGMAQEDC